MPPLGNELPITLQTKNLVSKRFSPFFYAIQAQNLSLLLVLTQCPFSYLVWVLGAWCGLSHQRTSFPTDVATRASQLLKIVHTDVCGPMKTTSHGGARYFLTFIDDFSRKTHVYLLKAKGEAFEKFKQYKALVENEIGHKSKFYVPTTEENLCLRSLTHFLRNVEFNDKQVRPIPHNKTMLWNVPIEPSWNVQET
jgi:hypothetical protein